MHLVTCRRHPDLDIGGLEAVWEEKTKSKKILIGGPIIVLMKFLGPQKSI